VLFPGSLVALAREPRCLEPRMLMFQHSRVVAHSALWCVLAFVARFSRTLRSPGRCVLWRGVGDTATRCRQPTHRVASEDPSRRCTSSRGRPRGVCSPCVGSGQSLRADLPPRGQRVVSAANAHIAEERAAWQEERAAAQGASDDRVARLEAQVSVKCGCGGRHASRCPCSHRLWCLQVASLQEQLGAATQQCHNLERERDDAAATVRCW